MILLELFHLGFYLTLVLDAAIDAISVGLLESAESIAVILLELTKVVLIICIEFSPA